jgi:hypothetical protein
MIFICAKNALNAAIPKSTANFVQRVQFISSPKEKGTLRKMTGQGRQPDRRFFPNECKSTLPGAGGLKQPLEKGDGI